MSNELSNAVKNGSATNKKSCRHALLRENKSKPSQHCDQLTSGISPAEADCCAYDRSKHNAAVWWWACISEGEESRRPPGTNRNKSTKKAENKPECRSSLRMNRRNVKTKAA